MFILFPNIGVYVASSNVSIALLMATLVFAYNSSCTTFKMYRQEMLILVILWKVSKESG